MPKYAFNLVEYTELMYDQVPLD